MRCFLLCNTFLILLFIFGHSQANAQSDPASEVIWRVNLLRESQGLPAYQVDYILMIVAQNQASWSAANNHIGHDGPGGSMPDDRAKAAGYGYGYKSKATENTAHGTASINTPELVVRMWQGDTGHLNAMISPDYENIGVGYAEAGGYSWYVMMVGWIDENSPLENGQTSLGYSMSYIPFELSQPDEQGAIYHEVKLGQTAWTIAARYGIGLEELLRKNNLREDSLLHVGDVLLIKEPDFLPTTGPSRIQDQISPTEIIHIHPDPSIESPMPSEMISESLFITSVIVLGLVLLIIIIPASRLH